ncbi:MAG: acyl-ACP--UDP-N-acetylglucosamine O-acyltransferase [Chloroherpetonaceae bacterium]|nr:acyl-ACP--UDP-N-acetylglucosamine O-acyltransferase [Chloroherpetonaceae bacterium]MCS7212402.1 acyl-ACP--UDP-N-acetylglucosamine O-acyltransferase [Chloroherpetonaceae bacterium]MDW8019334.1 acyl-ACP--UDP-N-acetylglucosamine O-acyltransferase [Chloroherpetonaceae bacterium]MDW8465473.1 acyl-ACP--UDP-N-acetylglucosamine O-acyltransferase [Chloroherpetonaceae bacterium]
MSVAEVDIHPTAIVSAGAKLGNGVKVGAYSVIEDDVEIGEGTEVGHHVVIYSGARIGKYCRIFPNAVIAAIPQDLKFFGEKTLLVVGDHTTIRECATLHRGTIALGKTVIGSHCFLMAYVHVAHDCVIGDNVIVANAVQFGGHVVVDEYAFLGGGSVVHQFTRIGKHAMIGGAAKVVHDVPPFVTADGVPARFEGINVVGLRRRNFSSAQINAMRDCYRIIFQSGLLLRNAIERVKTEVPDSPERQEILQFFEAPSKRQFIRPYTSVRHEG